MKKYLPNYYIKSFVHFAFVLLLILPFLANSSIVSQASAIEAQSISAYPANPTDADPRSKSWFIYSLPAGENKSDAVIVMNNGKEPVTLKVYPADSVRTSEGEFGLANSNVPKKDLGGWITINTNEITLAPGETRNIPFVITIPENAAKGEHSGGIVFENVKPKKVTSRAMNINLVSRVGVRIYQTVPGNEQLEMAVSNLTYATTPENNLVFNFDVENLGSVHAAPKGMLTVKDIFGRVIEQFPLEPLIGTVVPGEPVHVSVPTKILAPVVGWNSVEVAVYYSPTKAAVKHLTFMPNPWGVFGVLFVLLSVIAYFAAKSKLVHRTEKTHKVVVAHHIKIIAVCILLGVILLSGLISYLLHFYFGGQ